MDASRIQSHQHGADYGYSNDSDRGTSSFQGPYRPLHPGGQPLAQSASGAAAHGTQAQVLELLRARAAALSTIQDETMRTGAFEALIASVSGHDEQQRAGAIHLLLAQLPGLPQASRGDALSNLLLLCADVPDAARPGLFAALAQSVSCLPAPHRSSALREIAVGTRGMAAQERARPLLAIAEALSVLPDAQAQKTAHQMLRRLCEGAPAPAQMAAMEALARVDWLDPALGLDCAHASLQVLAQLPDASISRLLILLADGLPKMPEAHRAGLLRALLACTGRLAAMELAGVLPILHHAVTHLPLNQQPDARDAIERAGMPAVTGAGSASSTAVAQASARQAPPMDRAAFLQAVRDSDKRSPANRASALLALAASLDLLPQDERQAPFDALLDAARRLPSLQRGQVLERVALEIGQLPLSMRVAAWTSLTGLSGALPEQAQVALLSSLCAAVADLAQTQRMQAIRPLLTQAARLAEPAGPLGSALAGTISSLPEASRMTGFGMMMKDLDGMSARTRFALGIALADALRDLPAGHRSGAIAMLLGGSGRWPAKHRFTLLLRLAGLLPLLPQETMANTIQLLGETLGRQEPKDTAMSTAEETVSQQTRKKKALFGTEVENEPAMRVSDAPEASAATLLSEPDRAAILCAIGAALCSLPASHPCQCYGFQVALECATGLPVQHWIAVLESVMPGLLNGNLPARPKPLMHINEYPSSFIDQRRHGATKASGLVHLVLDLCEIFRSPKTNSIKNLMLRPSWEMRELFEKASQKAVQGSYETYFNLENGQACYFLDELMKQTRIPTAHYTAAFLVPLLGSTLDEELIVQHVLARGKQEKDGSWDDAIFRPMSDEDVYCTTTQTTLSLVLGSALSPEAKCRAILSTGYTKDAGIQFILPTIASDKTHAQLPGKWIRIFIDEISASGLPPSLANRLLAGTFISDKVEKMATPYPVVLVALAELNKDFLEHYAGQLASSRLPEESKVALLSGAMPGRNDVNEAIQQLRDQDKNATHRSADNEYGFKFYRELIATLPLADTSKQTLLALFH